MGDQDHIQRAISVLPSGLFVMTAAFEDHRAGMRVRSVAPCADEPVLISVAVKKGHFVEPLIRDSHTFAICLVSAEDRLILRKFRDDPDEEPGEEDPFAAFEVTTLVSGAPIFSKSRLAIDCEVVRHFDLEADHELYVGQVLAARIAADLNPAPPATNG